ncbi:hypothetical protein LINPERHAP2_LOCUS5847, partial [Linum perenne]
HQARRSSGRRVRWPPRQRRNRVLKLGSRGLPWRLSCCRLALLTIKGKTVGSDGENDQ